MDQIQVSLCRPAYDDNPPVNRRIVASPLAYESRQIVRGRNPVEQELVLAVRDRPREKRQQHIFEVVVHLQKPVVPPFSVAPRPLQMGYKPSRR